MQAQQLRIPMLQCLGRHWQQRLPLNIHAYSLGQALEQRLPDPGFEGFHLRGDGRCGDMQLGSCKRKAAMVRRPFEGANSCQARQTRHGRL